LRADLYPLFGGYWGYMAAPVQEIRMQTLVLVARKAVEARQNAEAEAEMQASKREAERMRR